MSTNPRPRDQRVFADARGLRSRDSTKPYPKFFEEFHLFITRFKGMTTQQLRRDGISEEVHFDFMWYHAYRRAKKGGSRVNFDFVADYEEACEKHLGFRQMRDDNEEAVCCLEFYAGHGPTRLEVSQRWPMAKDRCRIEKLRSSAQARDITNYVRHRTL